MTDSALPPAELDAPTKRCACVSPCRYECVAMRYQRDFQGGNDPCDCACHDMDEADWVSQADIRALLASDAVMRREIERLREFIAGAANHCSPELAELCQRALLAGEGHRGGTSE